MPENDFGVDAKAREAEYFRKRDQELMENERRRLAREAALRELSGATGIDDQQVLSDLLEFGFTAETVRLLHLVPLVQVAWADGGATDREKQQILEVARLRGVEPGSAAHQHLQAWLVEPPRQDFYRVALSGIRALLTARPAPEAGALKEELVSYCTRIASASGGFLGLGSRISAEEQQLIAHLASELETRHPGEAREVTRALEDK